MLFKWKDGGILASKQHCRPVALAIADPFRGTSLLSAQAAEAANTDPDRTALSVHLTSSTPLL